MQFPAEESNSSTTLQESDFGTSDSALVSNRRKFLSGLSGFAVAGGFASTASAWTPQCPSGSIAASPASPPANSSATLGSLARARNLSLGFQVSIGDTGSYGKEIYDPGYATLLLREQPDYLAIGNGFKFVQLCGADAPGADKALKFTQSQYNVANTWYEADDIVAKCKAGNVRARADALVQNSYSPSWLPALPSGNWWDSSIYASNTEYMTKFISAAMKKIVQYSNNNPNFFHTIGVVNEPISPFDLVNGQATYRGGPFQPAGTSVIAQSNPASYIWTALYQANYYNNYWASQLGMAASNAKLMLNETLVDTDQYGPVMRAALLSLVQKIKANNIPLHAVGLECHLQPQMMNDAYHPDWTEFGNFLQALGNLGVEIHITELDVLDYEPNCHGAKASAAQSDYLIDIYYDTFLKKALSYPAVKTVCFWNLSDRYSFYRMEDESKWFSYDTTAMPNSTGWPNCPTKPANASAISCARPGIYDDAFKAKSARAKVAAALTAAPSR